MPAAAASLRSMLARDFFERAHARLKLVVPPGLNDPNFVPERGDHELDPVLRAMAQVRPIRPAAVLIGIVDHMEPTVLLTKRTTDLSSHAGQIAFPGGKIDPSDASPLAAALREAQEEIGLDPRFVTPIGYLDLYLTTLGYRIVPTVASVNPEFELTLNAAEVADVFEVPLAFVMQPKNHERHSRQWQGLNRSYYAIAFGERYIWGVTAGILRNLYERLYAQ